MAPFATCENCGGIYNPATGCTRCMSAARTGGPDISSPLGIISPYINYFIGAGLLLWYADAHWPMWAREVTIWIIIAVPFINARMKTNIRKKLMAADTTLDEGAAEDLTPPYPIIKPILRCVFILLVLLVLKSMIHYRPNH